MIDSTRKTRRLEVRVEKNGYSNPIEARCTLYYVDGGSAEHYLRYLDIRALMVDIGETIQQNHIPSFMIEGEAGSG